jgi:tetratricopeptide (TPR) repeat protein
MPQRVYDRLARAAGEINPPKLLVQKARPGSPDRVAFMQVTPPPLRRREIVIDDKTIAICEKLGPQAEACVAYFLGHELAHFHNNHNWGSHFALQTVDKSVPLATFLDYETQADRFGGFYAALAGYDSLSVAGKALEMVYREYGIDSKLPGYLSLSDRQRVPELAREFLSGLLPMWDAGGLLFTLGYYRASATLYDAVLEQFPSREVYNNAGVTLASLIAPNLRWLLDGATRLPEPGVRRGEMDPAIAMQARDHFEKAIQLDRDYAVAHWNLGQILKLIGDDPEGSVAELKRAGRLAKGIDSKAADPGMVGTDPPQIDRTQLLPGGRRPSDMIPAQPNPVVQLGGGLTFYSRTLNGTPVFTVGPLRPDRRRVTGALVSKVPDDWKGRMGLGREIRLFPENVVLYEKLGVFVGPRGALVYQVR